MAGPTVTPLTYVKADSPVTELEFLHGTTDDYLIAGTESGWINFWNMKSWIHCCLEHSSTSDLPQGVLMIAALSSNALLVHRRNTSHLTHLELTEKNVFRDDTPELSVEPHPGFCRGTVWKCHREHPVVVAVPVGERDIDVLQMCATHKLTLLQRIRPASEDEGNKLGNLTSVTIADVDETLIVISCYEAQKIIVWSTDDGSMLSELDLKFPPLTLDFRDLRGVVAGASNKIAMFCMDEKSKIMCLVNSEEFPSGRSETAGISHVRIREEPKANIIAAGSWDSTVKIFSWSKSLNVRKSLSPLGALKFHRDSVVAVGFSKRPVVVKGVEMFVMAAGSRDRKISVWDIYN